MADAAFGCRPDELLPPIDRDDPKPTVPVQSPTYGVAPSLGTASA